MVRTILMISVLLIIIVVHRSVVIIDPGINNADKYKPYQDGVAQDIFIKVGDDGATLTNLLCNC